ncbi:MAG: methyltransferase domain-containing protein [Bacteroidetes bacterium]|nr:MAG: methyltransferase domain-containing protein [Bacteroidota bacterium]
MRYYPNLIKSAISALQRIFDKGEHAGTVVAQTLKSDSRWGSRDRRFVAENIYGIIRWYRLLYEVAGKQPETVQDWWNIFGIYQIHLDNTLPEWEEFKGLDTYKVNIQLLKAKEKRSIAQSVPEWMDELGEKQLGEEKWAETIHALNQEAPVVLRVNTLKTSIDQLQKELTKEGIEAEILTLDALRIEGRRKLTALKAFRKGHFEIQDFGSQLIAPYLEVEPGMKIIDACAGAGGKTLHLASIMKNQGEIISMDIHKDKLRELQHRVKRNGVQIVTTRIIKEGTISKLKESADRLLLDVPCTGSGVLRRKPDSKWKLSPELMQSLQKTQQNILIEYSPMVKKGGKLVYATCSVFPSENEEQVQEFLKKHADEFELEKEQTVYPQDGYDGFYMALLKRK